MRENQTYTPQFLNERFAIDLGPSCQGSAETLVLNARILPGYHFHLEGVIEQHSHTSLLLLISLHARFWTTSCTTTTSFHEPSEKRG